MRPGNGPSGEERSAAERGLITLRIIWGAILFSLFIYLTVAVLLSGTMQPALEGTGIMTVLRGVLYSVSVIVLFIAKFIRRRMIRRENGETALRSALGKYGTAVIVSLALSESIGIYGFVLFLLGGDRRDLFFLIALSAGAMVYYRPRIEELLAMTGAGESSGKEYRHGGKERW